MSESGQGFGGIDDDVWEALAEAARAVRKNAHVPYSNFSVGAAVLTPSGDIFAGCNVEVASIGGTVCAERNAMGCAVAGGHHRIRALCVITELEPPAAPCGICRQVLAEFGDELPMMLISPGGQRLFTTLDELLPMRFSGKDFLDQ